jgi:hypothetical protein
MSQSSERLINISACPLCGLRHTYALAVKRSIVLESLRSFSIETTLPRRFTRLFTCPTKDETFQADITLTDTSSDRIESVTVTGLAPDES